MPLNRLVQTFPGEIHSPEINNRRVSVGEIRGLMLLGLFAFISFCLIFAPAQLLAPAVERIPGAKLIGVNGTIWAGSGRLLVQGRDIGLLTWALRPTSLLNLFPEVDWTVSGEHLQLSGKLNLGTSRMVISMSGSVAATAINPWLAVYELSLSGDFNLRDLYLHITDGWPDDTRGTLNWSGGRLRYVLSQHSKDTQLPPLEARIGYEDGPRATVFEQDRTRPLLEATLLDNGFVRIGITMLLTRLLNEPWPGGGPDDKVVLAVEEKIL